VETRSFWRPFPDCGSFSLSEEPGSWRSQLPKPSVDRPCLRVIPGEHEAGGTGANHAMGQAGLGASLQVKCSTSPVLWLKDGSI